MIDGADAAEFTSAPEQQPLETIPDRLREISCLIDHQLRTLRAFDQFKVKDLISGDGSEGGVIFYQDTAMSDQFCLKFFHGKVSSKSAGEARWRVKVDEKYFNEDLYHLARGFPITTYLAQLGEPAFLPVDGFGTLSARFGYSIGIPRDQPLESFTLPTPERQQIPFIIMPYLKFAPGASLGDPDEYHDFADINYLEQELASHQEQLYHEFRGKTANQLRAELGDRLEAITRRIAADHGIGLVDIEPYVNLQTGDLKIWILECRCHWKGRQPLF
ncbi:MAG: hypothetical protein AAB647_04310 [Patescibacteria group bacterium]